MNSKVGMFGSLAEVKRDAIAKATHELSESGEYAVSLAAVRSFMKDLGFFLKDHFVAMDKYSCDTLLRFSVSAIL